MQQQFDFDLYGAALAVAIILGLPVLAEILAAILF